MKKPISMEKLIEFHPCCTNITLGQLPQLHIEMCGMKVNHTRLDRILLTYLKNTMQLVSGVIVEEQR